MTLPTPDAQPSRPLPRKQLILPPTHSIPPIDTTSQPSSGHASPLPPVEAAPHSLDPHEHALDFATHSLDLATGGLKTLTAKRELPLRPDRRAASIPDVGPSTRGYTLALVILACVVLILIGGGVILFIMLQP